jgi:crotonobetainyl-CoA:carnitine CoA-transferase CaiB-like acyl-CoA transferase
MTSPPPTSTTTRLRCDISDRALLPLSGLRIVDCSSGLAGPRTTGMLADYGADVVWIEPPAGDRYRDRLATAYSTFNRHKYRRRVDLRTPEGRATLSELLTDADVFVASWRPGVAENLGVDAATLHRSYPSLIHCSISGFGPDDRRRDIPGYESIVQAVIGSMGEQVGHRDGPIYPGLPFASIGAAHLAAIGILGAALKRLDDGLGRCVETSLFDGALAYLSIRWGDAQSGKSAHVPGTARLVATSYLCADGGYLGVHTGAVNAFGRLMRLLGVEEHFPPIPEGTDMGVALTPEQHRILNENLPAIFLTKNRAEWLDQLLAADICAIPHFHPGDVFDEAQPLHNGIVVTIDDPVLGSIQQVGPAIRFGAGDHDEVANATPVPVVETGWPGARRFTGPGSPSPQAGALLEGLRVVDFGSHYAGPFSSRLLADLGADVIKVEPLRGDPLRGLPTPFRSAQSGKRSIAVDLKAPQARDMIERLTRWADAVHHNYRPGVAERLGFGADQLRVIKPELVYLHAPGWGTSGPNRDQQSFAPMLSGYVGIGFEVAGQYNPPLWPLAHEDPGNALVGAIGILIGLLHRRRSGKGSVIENPQLNASMMHLAHVVRRTGDGVVLGAGKLDPLQLGIGPLERLYETADGWVCLAASDRRGEVLSALGAASPVTGDADLDDEVLAGVLIEAFGQRSTTETLTMLGAAGVAAWEPLTEDARGTLLGDPIERELGRVFEHQDPQYGRVREVGQLVRVSDCDAAPRRLAPELGQDTDGVLRALGYSAERVKELHDAGVVRSHAQGAETAAAGWAGSVGSARGAGAP